MKALMDYVICYGIDNFIFDPPFNKELINKMIDGKNNKCFHCHKYGHFINNCKNIKNIKK